MAASEDCSSSVESMTREEAKRILRRLELDAYSAVVTAFRAQGDISKGKKTLLHELSNNLSISTERHRAEVRRAANDDRLNAVAGCMYGPETSTEWSMEGRRLVSLMPRLVPQTVFTAKATAAANQAVKANQKLPIKTEIEVIPLPIKQKSLPPKPNERLLDHKELQKSHKFSVDSLTLSRIDEKNKRKKKANILYTKPSPISLNKSLMNPFKHSLSAASTSSMRPLIKPSVGSIKNSVATYSPSLSKSISTTLSSLKYTQKQIILQRSPNKSQPNQIIRTPNLNTSPATVNIPLTTLSSLTSSNKSMDSSPVQLIQSPMIKVVSNAPSSSTVSVINSNIISLNTSSLQNSITQKIRFKTPLPKNKNKPQQQQQQPAKFKSIVPVQRPNLLLNVSSTESALHTLSSNSSGLTAIAPSSPIKTVISGQNMSVKVVQVAKSSAMPSCSVSLLNSINRPVVVVSSNSLNKIVNTTQRVVTFNNISGANTNPLSNLQHTKSAASTSQLVASLSSTIAKSSLAAKSMPLATGFKMIAVTTVVPGTTQVKTVYIATPIMSLTKTVSQTNGEVITTASTPNMKSSIGGGNLLTVGRSINSSNINQAGRVFSMGTLDNTMNTPSIAVGKSLKMSTSKGLGHLKSVLTSGATPQSLKVFTSVSKGKTPYIVANNTLKNSPLLPSTSLLTSVVGQQQHFRPIKLVENDSTLTTRQGISKAPSIAGNSYTSLNSVNTIKILNQNEKRKITQSPVNSLHQQNSLQAATIILNNYEDVNSTLHLHNANDNSINTEQITASATGETDDLAFLSAGEKFLEQLSAKMTATSPESLSKKEQFMFPIELANNARSVSEHSKLYELDTKEQLVDFQVAPSQSTSENHLMTDNDTVQSMQPQSVLQMKQMKDSVGTSHIFIPKSLTTINNVSINTSRLPTTSVLNNNSNMTIVNQKLTMPPNALQINKQKVHQLINPHHQQHASSITLPKPVTFNLAKSETSKNPLSYSNSTIPAKINILKQPTNEYVSSSNELLTIQPSAHQNNFYNVGNNTLESNMLNSYIKISSAALSQHSNNKLPAPSKLNITPVLVNNTETFINSSSRNPVKFIPESFSHLGGSPSTSSTVAKNHISSTSSILNNNRNYTLLSKTNSAVSANIENITSSSASENIVSIAKVVNHQGVKPSQTISRNHILTPSSLDSTSLASENPKKRKLNATNIVNDTAVLAVLPTTPRTQASWIRGAVNLLQRVSRFRGSNKQKGEMNAASWFTKPVDALDAPGYYALIKIPMDFGKVKRKLEAGEYHSYKSFHDDMMLIKKNCYTYNPEGHVARKDCDDVFSFFENEYLKLLERWEKHHVSPQKKIKLSTEVS